MFGAWLVLGGCVISVVWPRDVCGRPRELDDIRTSCEFGFCDMKDVLGKTGYCWNVRR